MKARLMGAMHMYVLRGLHSSAQVLIVLLACYGVLFPTVSSASLVSSVLPTSRSTELGAAATAFATVINTGPGIATGCSIRPITSVPATFFYQTTDPATNALTGTPNTPIDIAEGAAQTFVFAFTSTTPFAPTDVVLSFDCTNTSPASSISGLNTLLLSASSTPVPDVIALATGTGILDLPASSGGNGAFAVATVNVGATGTITASVDTGSATLPVTLSVCETNPSTGACINPTSPAATATTTIAGGGTPTFAFFASATGTIPLELANNRAFVRFRDSGDVTRGSTSVALMSDVIAAGGGCTGGVYGCLTISGDSPVPSTFTPDTNEVSIGGGGIFGDSFQGSWTDINGDYWSIIATILDNYEGLTGSQITFYSLLSTTYTCASGFLGSSGDCGGATVDPTTRTVTFSNVQLRGPGLGAVITLNGALKY